MKLTADAVFMCYKKLSFENQQRDAYRRTLSVTRSQRRTVMKFWMKRSQDFISMLSVCLLLRMLIAIQRPKEGRRIQLIPAETADEKSLPS